MPAADTQTVAKLLREYAQRTALRGGNPYRAKAYSRAADSLALLAIPLHVLIEEGRITDIPGVGDAIADVVTKLHRTGTHPSLGKLRKEVPPGALEKLTACVPTRCYASTRTSALPRSPNWMPPPRTIAKKAKGLGAALQTQILQNLTSARSGHNDLHMHRAAALSPAR